MIPKVKVRQPFAYDVDAVSDESGLKCDPKEGVTQQSFRDECDINEIVRRFGLTGELPDNPRVPVSGDFRGISDFHSAMLMVRSAEEEFMRFPGEVRERFGHDPGAMIAFCEDPANREEAIRLGLIAKPAEVSRDVAAVDKPPA